MYQRMVDLILEVIQSIFVKFSHTHRRSPVINNMKSESEVGKPCMAH